jgi:tetratricopeptide (TPR) repeat protein
MLLQAFKAFRAPALIVLAYVILFPWPAVCQTAAVDPAADLIKQGTADLGSQRYPDAVAAFKKANQLRHDACAECYFGLAIAESRLGDMEAAVKSCDKAISCAADDNLRVASHNLKGNLLQQAGDDPKQLKAAESEYRAALELNKDDAAAHLNLGVTLLKESQKAEGIEELNSYLRIAPDGPNAGYARKLIAHPEHAGEALAPDFKVRTLDGQQISLDQLSGKVVVMDFWATWCGPCRESVSELKDLTKKYRSSELVLISFGADHDQQAWRDFIAKKNMEWPQYWDSDGRIRKEFAVNAFPTYIVIDPDGFIHERIVGLNPQQTVVYRLKDTLRTMLPGN